MTPDSNIWARMPAYVIDSMKNVLWGAGVPAEPLAARRTLLQAAVLCLGAPEDSQWRVRISSSLPARLAAILLPSHITATSIAPQPGPIRQQQWVRQQGAAVLCRRELHKCCYASE